MLIIAIDIGNLNVLSTAKKFLNEPNILSLIIIFELV